ncbi:fimbria/pilus periplasmic chaperone [Citrobacter amalonaticus]|uniref:fimbria/pilus periplasmic chaperone n=1 Tax=Citrobacter amalonaticus TaxID=35703 RepID=UPI0035C88956
MLNKSCSFLTLLRNTATVVLLQYIIFQACYAAITPDRTRIIFDGSLRSVSISVSNKNAHHPYLAQGWLEDDRGNKVKDYFTVLPPVQKIGPNRESQMRIQSLSSVSSLPADRESVFWFNLREIPPKSDEENSLQIALQSRLKLFYRPAAIRVKEGDTPWQEKITLQKDGKNQTVVHNPTPYFVTIAEAGSHKGGSGIKGFEPVMIPPFSRRALNISPEKLGNSPVLTYVNDYGGRPELQFICSGTICHVKK